MSLLRTSNADPKVRNLRGPFHTTGNKGLFCFFFVFSAFTPIDLQANIRKNTEICLKTTIERCVD